jgi:diguanylate cyclase (GGDEF)-like protein
MFGFLKRSSGGSEGEKPPASDDGGGSAGGARLTAALIRLYGAHSFDTDDRSARALAAMCDRWAANILDGSEPPEGAEPGPVGLRRFFERQRRDESHYVETTLAGLRAVIAEFVAGLKRIAASDGASDTEALVRLDRLREIATTGSADDLRREALSTVENLASTIQERRLRSRNELASLGERIDELGEALDEARKRSESDPLTGLPNRGALDAQLDRAVTLSSIFGRSSVLLLLDIDHFKRVNDTLGHPAGDAVIKGLATCLTRAFLRRDDFVARYGGEEFAVIIRGAHQADARNLAERLLTAVRSLAVTITEHQVVRPTVSVGVAAVIPGESVESWLSRADRALYAAKNAGRARAILADHPETQSGDGDGAPHDAPVSPTAGPVAPQPVGRASTPEPSGRASMPQPEPRASIAHPGRSTLLKPAQPGRPPNRGR